MEAQPNELMSALKKSSQHFMQILTENSEWQLAVPPTGFFSRQQISIDEMCINEHILQISFDGKEMTSMSGKAYKVESETRLRLLQGGKETDFVVSISSRDSYFADNQKELKRMFISNCLDQRFAAQEDEHKPIEEKKLRDPFAMIQFFKSEVYLVMEEEYQEVLEDIKILKENHVLLYENFQSPSKFFQTIVAKFSEKIEQTEPIEALCQHLSDSRRNEFLENFTETLIYERVGSYLLKSLVKLYSSDELRYREKFSQIYQIATKDRARFNQLFGSSLPEELEPSSTSKSVQILKVFWKCQLPFEMFYTLHETASAATEELAQFLNKPKNAISAEYLQPFLILICAKTFHDLYFKHDQSAEQFIADERKDGFRVRLILMEHFTAHSLGMSKQDYSFVTFKELEQRVLEVEI